MSDRDELEALRRLAELEAKAGGASAATGPTGSTLENIAAGSGKAVADAMRGAVLRSGQALANAPASLPMLSGLNMLLEKVGVSPRRAVEDVKADIAESRRLDAPLMATGGGVAGNLATNALLLAPTAAANTPAAAGVIGGLAGLGQPALTAREGVVNTLLGVAGGAGSQYVANKVPALLQSRVDAAKAVQSANAPRFDAARAAAREGYVIPPADLEPGMLSEAVSGLSGKIKTAQTASQRNQLVTDRLAKRALGVPEDEVLSAQGLQAIRNEAAATGYAPVRNSGMVKADQQYQKALDAIAEEYRGASKAFPGLADNGVPEMIGKLQQPLFDASGAVDGIRVLRAMADKAYTQGDKIMGKASKSAADAVEGMLERHLEAAGNPGALDAFRQARTLIAKTYSVQKGLNSETGSVSAAALAKQLQKGKPLTDELLTIGTTASVFPKATQVLKEAPKQLSPLDFAVATGSAASSGHLAPLAMLGVRPLARNALLSGPVQARALQQSTPVPLTQATQALLENKLAQLALTPVGTAAAVNFGQ